MSYDLKSVKLPRLVGRPLQLFAAALGMRSTRALLAGRLLRDGGILRLRALTFAEPPTFLPIGFVEAASSSGDGAERVMGSGWPAEAAEGSANRATVPREIGDAEPTGRRLPFPGIRDYESAYRNGTTTPEAVAERALEAIAASDSGNQPLRLFIASDRADVLAQARAST